MDINSNLTTVPKLKLSIKTIIIIVLFGFGIYFLIPRIWDANEAIKLILKVNKLYLLLAVSFEFISYMGAAWLLGIILSRLGYKIPFWDRFKMGSIAAFATHFFPVASFGEGAINFYFLKKKKVETGSILIMFILRIIFSYLAFFSLLLTAVILVPTIEDLSLTPKLIAAAIFLLVLGGFIYLFYLYEHKDKFNKVWGRFLIPINYMLRKIHQPLIGPKKSVEIFDDIYEGISLFNQKKRNFVLALLAGLVYWLGDVMCFFFVFRSFGYDIHFGVLTFSYCLGSLAGMVSFIPGGLGVTEGTLGLILTGLGTPSTIALMSILVFRFFSFWIWIPVGLCSFFSLRKNLK